jgi:hypothetical protein
MPRRPSTLARIAALVSLLSLSLAASARAEVVQAPISGKALFLGDARVLCEAPSGGWIGDAAGRSVRPPRASEAVGQAVEVKVAADPAACASAPQTVSLLATERWPAFDPGSVVFAPDEGRLELRGRRLRGMQVAWKNAAAGGADVCRAPVPEGDGERCTFAVARGASADRAATSLSFTPAGGRSGPDVATFDADGRRVSPDELALVPARVELTRLLPPDAAIDMATGQGEVPLVHPEVVTSAECRPLQCDMVNGKLLVRGAASLVNAVEIELRFSPNVVFVQGDARESRPRVRLAVLHCPMSIASGPPFRNNDEAKLVVRLAGACTRDLAALRFAVGSLALKTLASVEHEGASYVLLRLGRVGDESLTVTALRGEPEAIALAVAHSETRDAPAVRASLELGGYSNLDFIPSNRPARVHVSSAGEHARFALLPIEGVYVASTDAQGATFVRGDRNAAGLTSLRFGVRARGLPGDLDDADLAVVSDPLQRGIREANVPVPISNWVERANPLIEMRCGVGRNMKRVLPGLTAHIPFDERDSCRVIFHRERLPPEYGTQKLKFEIEVVRPDGGARGEAHVLEVLTLRAGKEPRQAWVRGVMGRFDRVIVRVSHEADEQHYIDASEIRTGAPAAQWSAILGTGRARLYGTTAIPTGLYRLSSDDYSGVLSLNFGVLSRLTWLDSEGHEGFLGLEAGILVMGLANSTSSTGQSLTQVGAVIGLGLAVPIANLSAATQASINLHAWYEYDLTRDSDDDEGRHAIIFGPSISIGNVGLDF